MTTLATHVRTILAGLQAAIAPIAARERARIALLLHIWTSLVRPTLLFEQLLADWRAGILPEQQTPAPSPANACPAAAPGRPASATTAAAAPATPNTSARAPKPPIPSPPPRPPASSAPSATRATKPTGPPIPTPATPRPSTPTTLTQPEFFSLS